MLLVSEAESLILSLVQPLADQVESLGLVDAVGRVLAQPVVSQLDFPHWDNSAMDGYAVRYADVQTSSVERPVSLTVIEEIPAGYQPQKTVATGQAARILTGGVMPTGADTIVMQEETQRLGDRVLIQAAPKPHAFVRQKGAFYQAGQPLLAAGVPLNAPEIAVLAATQCAQVSVFRRPRVAILSTGDELMALDQPLQPGQIVDSNRYALAALLTQMGMQVLPMGIVPDQPEALRQAIAAAICSADVVLSSGGVSVGDYDYVDQILAELGADIHIRAVAVKPGKPLTVATFDVPVAQDLAATQSDASTPMAEATLLPRRVLYFGLPGNPVSALVTFWRFVQPALRKLSGVQPPWDPEFVPAIAQQALTSDGKRESYLWGQVRFVQGRYQFDLAGGSHSSGNLINLMGTNGLAVVPLGQQGVGEGEEVWVMRVDE
jgi:molybdopterin molybdotransferase